MGKVKDMIMDWIEDYESGVPLEFTRDKFNWFDAKEAPQFDDGKWYRRKESTEENQSDDYYLPE